MALVGAVARVVRFNVGPVAPGGSSPSNTIRSAAYPAPPSRSSSTSVRAVTAVLARVSAFDRSSRGYARPSNVTPSSRIAGRTPVRSALIPAVIRPMPSPSVVVASSGSVSSAAGQVSTAVVAGNHVSGAVPASGSRTSTQEAASDADSGGGASTATRTPSSSTSVPSAAVSTASATATVGEPSTTVIVQGLAGVGRPVSRLVRPAIPATWPSQARIPAASPVSRLANQARNVPGVRANSASGSGGMSGSRPSTPGRWVSTSAAGPPPVSAFTSAETTAVSVTG